MQNLLKKNQQGFTLVELLVAIAIIAILAIIGLTVFTGLQRGARDATRRSDVQAISKALEANYNTTGGAYSAIQNSQFAGGTVPVDPLSSTTNCAANLCVYCIDVQLAGTLPNPQNTGVVTGTASAPTCGTNSATAGLNFLVANNNPTQPNVTGYIVCANLETSGVTGVYCQGSQR